LGTTSHVVLAHLSQQCNEPSLAIGAVREGLARTGYRGAVSAATQDAPVGPFVARTRGAAGEQLTLL
jgi:hypothetical protein